MTKTHCGADRWRQRRRRCQGQRESWFWRFDAKVINVQRSQYSLTCFSRVCKAGRSTNSNSVSEELNSISSLSEISSASRSWSVHLS